MAQNDNPKFVSVLIGVSVFVYSRRRLRLDLRQVNLGFVLNWMALGEFFFKYFWNVKPVDGCLAKTKLIPFRFTVMKCCVWTVRLIVRYCINAVVMRPIKRRVSSNLWAFHVRIFPQTLHSNVLIYSFVRAFVCNRWYVFAVRDSVVK